MGQMCNLMPHLSEKVHKCALDAGLVCDDSDMPSTARAALDRALVDVRANIDHAKTFTGGRRGAPAASAGISRPGRPFLRGAVVLLGAAVEAYVEGLAAEVGGQTLSGQQVKDLKEQIRHSHGASARHIHQLLAPLGLPFALDGVSWRGFPRGTARTVLDEIASARNKIAHGNAANATTWVVELERWYGLIPKIADRLDRLAASHVQDVNGLPAPLW
ncbi:hypothetical protein [Aeromicrobium duanguangcaii]|uniref:hypothetical protein n=1 Tax=Aeromicrobium duanguangcaii TaxID=2968086 RepID=UPI002016C511|nr:hypothetical protein [Aeromicrobium duanguangcaii]MCL3838017.1 hypothetical protein [Aeromicrobium duanguangcaii]